MKEIFEQLARHYAKDELQIQKRWLEIETAYTNKKRYYHNLTHLQEIHQHLLPVKKEIKNWNCILFSIFYHDIVYQTTKQNNEEKSAQLAKKRLQEINVSEDIQDLCFAQILATKQHAFSTDADTNYFTDADLAILGQNEETYLQYAKQIRKEYSIYPDFMYKPGRKKVLQHFLQMETIFKTVYFQNKFEAQAKHNLNLELNQYL